MPVHKIQGGYQYGKTGKKYYGKDAKKKAKLQELAIRLSGYKEDDEKKKRRYLKHEADSESIGREFVSEFFNDDQLEHHGILGQKWGIRRFQPYPKGYHGDGKFTGKLTRDQKLSKKNIKNAETANLEKFGKDREHNVLYIAGYSGSGKSTMASGIAKKNDKIIRLDFYADPVNRETRGLRDKEFNRFLDKKGIDYKRVANAYKREQHAFYNTGRYWKEVDAIREAITEYSKEQFDKSNRVIVEGIQIPDDWLSGEKSYYKGKPMIIMRTPILTSIHRGSRRDGITGLKEIKHAKEVYAFFKRSNKSLDDLAKETGAIKNGREFISEFFGDDHLAHHGVLGQKWGKRNGPPYPLDAKGQLAKVHQMIDDLNTKWDYGALVDGKRVTDTSQMDWSKYRTLPLEKLAKEKIGVCWDFVNYQHAVCKKNGYPDKNYMIVCRRSKDPNDILTHTFTVVDIGGKSYWLESARWKDRGVHEVKSYKDVVEKLQKDDFGNKPYDLYEFNPDGMDKGLTGTEYFDKATQNLVETSQKNYKKIT